MNIKKGYSFDDVLLVPKYSKIKSRSDVDLSVNLPYGIKLGLPIVSAPMKSIMGMRMAKTLVKLGALALLHRFDNHRNIIDNFTGVYNIENNKGVVGASVGIKEDDYLLSCKLYDVGCRVLCVDVAHGNNSYVINFVNKLRNKFSDLLIIAGNVVTEEGASRLWEAGADLIRIGIGSGSLCTTRIETGNGYPQLSALDLICGEHYQDIRDSEGNRQYPIFISDGGIRTAGDIVKALCFSDLVMIGNLLAGTHESPGDRIVSENKLYKQYAGSSTHGQKHIEGVIGLVPYRGNVENVIEKLVQGIKSGCSYQGVSNISDLKLNPEFVEISNSSLKESHPHNVKL